MSSQSLAFAGDWGTSHLRLYAFDQRAGEVVSQAAGKGAGAASGHAAVLEGALDAVGAEPDAPVLLSGAIGAYDSWLPTDYVPCPASLSGHAQKAQHFVQGGRSIFVLPGLCIRPENGGAGVMRGEETQILGWLARLGSVPDETLICLPGTHSKWVWLDAGCVTRFRTALTGEMFAHLVQHSSLLDPPDRVLGASVPTSGAFLDGVHRAADEGTEGLIFSLFSTRADRLLDIRSPKASYAYLSGLLIGAELVRARRWCGEQSPTLIAAPALRDLYSAAGTALGLRWADVPEGDMAAAGLYACLKERGF